jgi:hypothetical protein
MMKKIVLFAVAMLMTVAANAQFEQGKGYLGASVSGFDISSQAKKFHLGLNAKVGYLLFEDIMLTAQVGYEHLKGADDGFQLGAGGRYYIAQNGLFLGADLKYRHGGTFAGGENCASFNDFVPGVQVGYAFFISRTVTFEPELYFDISTKKFDYSSYGLRLGVGVYLFRDQTKN